LEHTAFLLTVNSPFLYILSSVIHHCSKNFYLIGGLRAASGAFTVALAAKHFSVPVIVLVPMFKMSPVFLFNYEQEAFNLVGSTQSVLPYNTKVSRQVKAYSPAFDYVPPRLITLFISST
jgi:translation initiation factor eIF-2B subunit beta